MTIYVIYHILFSDANIFTTDKTKIPEIIQQQIQKYPFSNEPMYEWRWREIVEETEFVGELAVEKDFE